MSFENFAYWLQGYFELSYTAGLTNDQVRIIKEHLNLCFNKVTPSALAEPYCAAEYKKLITSHTGLKAQSLC